MTGSKARIKLHEALSIICFGIKMKEKTVLNGYIPYKISNQLLLANAILVTITLIIVAMCISD